MDRKYIAIDDKYRNEVCKFGQGSACCSFLTLGPIGFICAKATSLEPLLLKRRAEKSIRAMGDNCVGYDPQPATAGEEKA